MTLNSFILDFVSIGAIITGILVITSKNPVLSVLFLIAVFLNIAGYLVLHGTTYLGLAYIIIYVGAIAILFLFVIMMLNIKATDLVSTGQEYAQNLPLGTVLIVLFAWEMLSILPESATWYNTEAYLLLNKISDIFTNFGAWINSSIIVSFTTESIPQVIQVFPTIITDGLFSNFTQIESIGIGLYTHFLPWLLGGSVILLLAIVGPIVLCIESEYGTQSNGSAHHTDIEEQEEEEQEEDDFDEEFEIINNEPNNTNSHIPLI